MGIDFCYNYLSRHEEHKPEHEKQDQCLLNHNKTVPKEATTPRHLSDDEEDAPVAAVNTSGTLRDRTIITLLLHTGLRAKELCTLTCKQVHVGKMKRDLSV